MRPQVLIRNRSRHLGRIAALLRCGWNGNDPECALAFRPAPPVRTPNGCHAEGPARWGEVAGRGLGRWVR